jgi:hypothetical protein
MSDSLLDVIDFFKRLPKETDKAASLAINQVVQRGGMSLIRSDILSQIAFPQDYLTDDRLRITKYAKTADLEAVISARHRPTSLARFAQGQALGSRARIGVKVTVKRGRTEHLRQSWLVRLKNGNIGLAVRVKPGETFGNKNIQPTVWLVPDRIALLYGPSVDQVFDTTRDRVSTPIGNMVQAEFLRQFHRLTQ